MEMEREELVSKLVSMLADEFEVDESSITPDAPIKQTLGLDSLSLVDMVALVDDEFGVEIKQSEISTIKTFSDLYEYIGSRL